MTTTTVTYHDHAPAINVKVHAPGYGFWPDELAALSVATWPPDTDTQPIGRTTAADLVDAAYNITQAEFWDAAESMAAPVLGPISQDGRSGGWLVIDNDPTHGGDDNAPPEWLAEYRALREWAEEFIAAAPRRVASLALRLAMDELGRDAARRMFGEYAR